MTSAPTYSGATLVTRSSGLRGKEFLNSRAKGDSLEDELRGDEAEGDYAYRKIEKRRFKRVKDENLLKTVEEVFDKSTLLAVYDLLNRGVIRSVSGVVDAGKESRVYAAEDASGKSVALKIYLTSSSEFRKGISQYIDGDERFRRVKRDTRQLIYQWTKKEFRNLSEAQAVGVRVPKPYVSVANVLAMEFIGEAGERDPLLRESLPTDPEQFLVHVLDFVKILYSKANLIHADLSEYNIMVQNESPVFIDLAQGVLSSHPLADVFLKRDIKNTLHFFSKGAGIKIPNSEEVYAWVKGEKPSFRYAST